MYEDYADCQKAKEMAQRIVTGDYSPDVIEWLNYYLLRGPGSLPHDCFTPYTREKLIDIIMDLQRVNVYASRLSDRLKTALDEGELDRELLWLIRNSADAHEFLYGYIKDVKRFSPREPGAVVNYLDYAIEDTRLDDLFERAKVMVDNGLLGPRGLKELREAMRNATEDLRQGQNNVFFASMKDIYESDSPREYLIRTYEKYSFGKALDPEIIYEFYETVPERNEYEALWYEAKRNVMDLVSNSSPEIIAYALGQSFLNGRIRELAMRFDSLIEDVKDYRVESFWLVSKTIEDGKSVLEELGNPPSNIVSVFGREDPLYRVHAYVTGFGSDCEEFFSDDNIRALIRMKEIRDWVENNLPSRGFGGLLYEVEEGYIQDRALIEEAKDKLFELLELIRYAAPSCHWVLPDGILYLSPEEFVRKLFMNDPLTLENYYNDLAQL